MAYEQKPAPAEVHQAMEDSLKKTHGAEHPQITPIMDKVKSEKPEGQS